MDVFSMSDPLVTSPIWKEMWIYGNDFLSPLPGTACGSEVCFPEMGVPPNHPFEDFLWYPHFWKPTFLS